MRTIRTIAYIIILYVAAFVIWWMILLTKMEGEKFDLQLKNYRLENRVENVDNGFLETKREYERNKKQIIYEGIVFLILLGGSSLYVIRGINRQKKFQDLKRNFLLATTHELKTPLSATKLNLQTLKHKKIDEDQKSLLLTNSLSEIERLNQLVNNILLATKLDASDFEFGKETVNISYLIKGLTTKHILKSRIKTDIEENLFIDGDPMAVEIIITNLIDNALKYSPDDSEIKLELTLENKNVILNVIDNGIGVPINERNRIFERFYRVEDEKTRKTKGTGLGLFLVKEMVENMNGKVAVNNNNPNGSIFTVMLSAKNE